MANALAALARVRRTAGNDLLPDSVLNQQLVRLGVLWRDRLLPPIVTLRLFLLQILFGNTSITHLRQLSGIDFAPSSYCEARLRLSVCLLRSLLRYTIWQARELGAQTRIGVRVLIADCTTFSMPDTPALTKLFGLPKSNGCKSGVSYPLAKAMALMDLASGCLVKFIPGELYRHEASGVVRLHRKLRQGDILLADRAFCSFVHIALLNLRGVLACFRLHQRRRSVRRGIERWKRPAKCPTWMYPKQFAALPQWIEIRIVRYTLKHKGYRTRHIALATTLLDEQLWSDAQLAELYGQRWSIETCFDHLKTTLNMSVLKCKSVGGIVREMTMYLIAYNLIRLAMLAAARQQGKRVNRVSFIDAMRHLAVCLLGLGGVKRLLINPHRPGRRQPRVIRRRMKEYDLLSEPRATRIAWENRA